MEPEPTPTQNMLSHQEIRKDEQEKYIINCRAANFMNPPISDELNKIQTSKYTWYNCIFKILYEQFSKMANIYFLIIAIFQCIKEVSNADGKPIILMPLMVIVCVNGLKDFYEDWKRKKSDDEENHRPVDIFNFSTKTFERKMWEEIRIGQIIKIFENDFIPADCVLLYSSEKNQGCFVETKNLDGETNLKNKKGISKFIDKLNGVESGEEPSFSEENFFNIQGTLTTKLPNEFIYEFNGSYQFSMEKEPIYIGIDSILLRGCSLRQTEFVYGLVVYTGHNSKIMKNSPKARHKISSVEHIMNMQIIFIFICQIVLSVIAATFCVTQINILGGSHLEYIFPEEEENDFGFLYFIYRLGTWIVLLNNLVPISLLVTMEMVKYVQGFFISWDCNIYDKKSCSMAKVQTSTLNEELGQVKYIFSDKTGTLTKNFMVLKQVAVGNKRYGKMPPQQQKEIKNNNEGNNDTSIDDNNFPDGVCEVSLQNTSSFCKSLTEENMGTNEGVTDELLNHKNDFIPSQKNMTDEYGVCTNVEFLDGEFENDLDNGESIQKENLKMFLSCISTCHSINIDEKYYEKTHKIRYQSSSPDETAILNFARLQSYLFMGRDINNNIHIFNTEIKKEEIYNILCEFEYSSERKRMTIILRCPDGKIRMFTKGADSVLFPRVNQVQSPNYDQMVQFVDAYAKEGLRTLTIVYREIPENEFQQISLDYNNALNDVYKKEEMLANLADRIENNFVLLGITGIEDQLQDNIDDALFSFNVAGIKFWLLTGDKKETAKSIAMSCKLINNIDFKIFEFEEGSSPQQIEQKLNDFTKQYFSLSHSNPKMKFALIVAQGELANITGNEHLKESFYQLANNCNTVLCCRVTPKQKAEMVLLIKERQPNVTTLAIGDGANDVNMITAANIGVGIYGVEGKQAARASDYAIGEFQFLKRLLFVHGRESYRKNSFIVCYNFYKNFIFVIPQFILGFESLFGGQTIYDPFIYQLYNILYAAFPIIWFGFYDKEVSFNSLLKQPKYYTQGIIGKLFSTFRFWKFIFYGFVHGLIVYIFSFRLIDSAYNEEGDIRDLYLNGIICYSYVIIIVNVKVLQTTASHSWFSFGLFMISNLLYYISVWLSSYSKTTYNYRRFMKLIGNWNYYLKLFCCLALCMIVELGVKLALKYFGVIHDPLNLEIENTGMSSFIRNKNEEDSGYDSDNEPFNQTKGQRHPLIS